MPYRKETYSANGHDVTIQQVNESGGISMWIDGWAGYEQDALRVFQKNDGFGNSLIAEKIKSTDDQWEGLKTLLAWMTDNDYYFCHKCDSFYDSDTVSGTGFAGHICGGCASEKARCKDNPTGNKHEDTCLNPHQRHNARVATKYKCEHCGRVRKTTPTG